MFIQDKADQLIVINECHKEDAILNTINLSRLFECTVEIDLHIPLCVFIDAITECRVIFRHSVVLNQLRIHNSFDSTFEICSTGPNAIILENCKALKFYSEKTKKISIFDFSDPLHASNNYESSEFSDPPI